MKQWKRLRWIVATVVVLTVTFSLIQPAWAPVVAEYEPVADATSNGGGDANPDLDPSGIVTLGAREVFIAMRSDSAGAGETLMRIEIDTGKVTSCDTVSSDSGPSGIAVEPGTPPRIWFGTQAKPRLARLDPTGWLPGVNCGAGSIVEFGPGTLTNPRGIAILPGSPTFVFVADGTGDSIDRFNTADGSFSQLATAVGAIPELIIIQPGAVPLTLFWTQQGTNNLVKAVVTTWPTVVTVSTITPNVAGDPTGLVWVPAVSKVAFLIDAPSGSQDALILLDPSTLAQQVVLLGFDVDPKGGLALDPITGQLFWIETGTTPDRIRSYDPATGTFNVLLNTPTDSVGPAVENNGITFDSNGNIFFSEQVPDKVAAIVFRYHVVSTVSSTTTATATTTTTKTETSTIFSPTVTITSTTTVPATTTTVTTVSVTATTTVPVTVSTTVTTILVTATSSVITTTTSTRTQTETTTKTVTTTETRTTTVFVTTPFVVGPPACPVAAAIAGSELEGAGNALRAFRNNQIMGTCAGASFMRVFNAWYYSWAPFTARLISDSEPLRAALRVMLYPLMGILYGAAYAYGTIEPISTELAAVVAGLVTSSLIGLVYFAPQLLIILKYASIRLNRKLQVRPPSKALGLWWLGSATALAGSSVFAPACANAIPMMASTSSLVLSTLAYSTFKGLQGFQVGLPILADKLNAWLKDATSFVEDIVKRA